MRLITITLLLASTAFGQALSVTCTKATQGSTATCTGSGGTGPYTYSVSAGSGSIVAGTGVYTPPAVVEVKQRYGPCQFGPPDHVYNTRIDGLSVHADSATIITRGGSSFQPIFEVSLPWNILTNVTPTFDAVFGYTPSNNGAFQFADWPLGKIQSGWWIYPYGVADRHLHAVNRETCEFSDIYNKYPAGSNLSCPLCTSAGGVKYSSDFAMPTSGATDAAGMLIMPLLLRLSDIQSGVVRHPLRFTVDNPRIQSGASTNFQWPALTGNSTPTCSAPCWKYGMYARLKSSVDISSFSATAQIILTGLKHYGMIMTDGGTDWGIGAAPDTSLDSNTRAALREIRASALRNTDYEVVDTSSLDLSNTSAAVNLAAVTPSQYAEVTVTDAAMATATTRVNLAGIVVGVAEEAMTVMAGHTVTPTWWVTGTATQTVTWAMSPDVGTINSSTGQFTPDSGVTAPVKTRLTATSTVEATAQAFVDVVVWPDNAGGNIYADWGAGDTASKTYDTKTFWPDEWTQAEGWNGVSDAALAGGDIYRNTRFFLHDTLAKWYLPNGNYKARIYLKTNAYNSSTPVDPATYQIHYESQGELIYRDYSIGRATGGFHQTGGYLDLPMKVTDGSGRLAFRHLGPATSVVYISAIGIEADASDPHLEIDTGGVTADITIGQTRQFYAVGWYMANTVTWAVQSGPGSIDSNGLYTAPSTPPATDTAVTIRATSTVDGMVYAETSFDFAFGTVTVTGPAFVSRGQTAQFTAAIGGVSYTNVTWSRSGAQGSINSSTGLYTAPASISDATIVITATPVDAGGSAGNANLDLDQVIAPIRVWADVIGNGLTENGRTWLTWPGPCTANGSSTASGPSATIVGLPYPEQAPLYKDRRQLTGAGTFGLDCNVPNGAYSILFKWANASATNLKAKFDVQLEGVTVATGLDITAEAGAVLTALDRTYTTVVTDGVLTLRLVGVSNAPSQQVWAQFNSFEVTDLGPVVGSSRTLGKVNVVGVTLK